MKIKSLVLIIVAAVVTLSFSFVSFNKTKESREPIVARANDSAPAGGFALED